MERKRREINLSDKATARINEIGVLSLTTQFSPADERRRLTLDTSEAFALLEFLNSHRDLLYLLGQGHKVEEP